MSFLGPREYLPQERVQSSPAPGEWSQGSRNRDKDGQHKEQMSMNIKKSFKSFSLWKITHFANLLYSQIPKFQISKIPKFPYSHILNFPSSKKSKIGRIPTHNKNGFKNTDYDKTRLWALCGWYMFAYGRYSGTYYTSKQDS